MMHTSQEADFVKHMVSTNVFTDSMFSGLRRFKYGRYTNEELCAFIQDAVEVAQVVLINDAPVHATTWSANGVSTSFGLQETGLVPVSKGLSIFIMTLGILIFMLPRHTYPCHRKSSN